MSRLDGARNLLHARILYWGPVGSGKTTTLSTLGRFLDPEERYRLYSVTSADGSTLAFDLLPIEDFRVGQFRVRARAFATSGAASRATARLALLRDADTVVFVADARRTALEANRQSLEELYNALRTHGMSADAMPIICAINHQDEPDTVPASELRDELDLGTMACFESVAADGRGVFETFSDAFRRMVGVLARNHESLGVVTETAVPTLLLPQLVRGASSSTPATRASGPHHLKFEVPTEESGAARSMAALRCLTEAHIEADARNLQLEGRNRELMAINRVARSILSAMEADNLLVVLLDATADFLGATHATCVLFDPTREGALRTHVLGFGRDPVLGTSQAAAHQFFGMLCESDGPVPASEERNPDLHAEIIRVDRRVKRALFQPIKANSGKPVGWLGIYATADEPPLTTQGLLFLSSISRLAAMGVDKIALLEKSKTFSESLGADVRQRTGELEMAYAKIRALNRGLEARVTERTRALEEANQKLKEARAGAVHGARLGGMGQLAASFAQEVSSPIATLHQNLEMMRENLDELRARVAAAAQASSVQCLNAIEEFEEVIESSIQSTDRINSVIGSLRRLGAGGGAEQEKVSLNGVLADAITVLEERIRSRAELDLRLGTVPEIDGDPSELSHAVLALLTNAVEAIERKGQRGCITVTTFQTGDKATLMVTDDGDGIDDELLPKVFEPFVTTKDEASAGLGLHVAFKSATQHGGTIKVRSKLGEGTSVTVVLPVAATSRRKEKETAPAETRAKTF